MFRLFSHSPKISTKLVLNLTVNGSLLAYATNWRKNHVEDVYHAMSEEAQMNIYNNCPVQKYSYCGDAIATVEEKYLTIYPALHESDKPLNPFKAKR